MPIWSHLTILKYAVNNKWNFHIGSIFFYCVKVPNFAFQD
jgi:hypothetical protein